MKVLPKSILRMLSTVVSNQRSAEFEVIITMALDTYTARDVLLELADLAGLLRWPT